MMDLMDRVWLLTQYCTGTALNTLACYEFWVFVCALMATIATYLIASSLWAMWTYRQKWKAALLAEQQRNAVADDETMKRYRWAGDSNYSETPSK